MRVVNFMGCSFKNRKPLVYFLNYPVRLPWWRLWE